ncbi:MAG TPA: SOS response-associated peptidase [Methanoregulaceae archaeon]|nr:SOS response-associated peptidase [Methanoregulaceae archaeon]HPD75075.1 SOS response-associated peptidase [Methanoregulaceae archaeon]
MCGRYALWGIDDLGGRFLIIDPMLGIRSHFNIAPGTENPVVIREQGGNRLRMMEWGLVPYRLSGNPSTPRPINARAESLAEKPVFAGLLASNRCIVPANGFYEWKKDGGSRKPQFIHIRDKALFGIAGLCDRWQDASGKMVATYTIITTEPNGLVRPLHNRMPAILRREDEQRWLSPSPPAAGELRELLAPYPAEEMTAYPVSPAANNPANDGGELICPLRPQKSWFG